MQILLIATALIASCEGFRVRTFKRQKMGTIKTRAMGSHYQSWDQLYRSLFKGIPKGRAPAQFSYRRKRIKPRKAVHFVPVPGAKWDAYKRTAQSMLDKARIVREVLGAARSPKMDSSLYTTHDDLTCMGRHTRTPEFNANKFYMRCEWSRPKSKELKDEIRKIGNFIHAVDEQKRVVRTFLRNYHTLSHLRRVRSITRQDTKDGNKKIVFDHKGVPCRIELGRDVEKTPEFVELSCGG